MKSNWHFPPDLAALLGVGIIPAIIAMVLGFLLTPLFRARHGDASMLYVAAALAAVGIAMLFFARLPLYRQCRFFTFGPGALDCKHRRLYRWAYGFIGSSAVLLLLLHLIVR